MIRHDAVVRLPIFFNVNDVIVSRSSSSRYFGRSSTRKSLILNKKKKSRTIKTLHLDGSLKDTHEEKTSIIQDGKLDKINEATLHPQTTIPRVNNIASNDDSSLLSSTRFSPYGILDDSLQLHSNKICKLPHIFVFVFQLFNNDKNDFSNI